MAQQPGMRSCLEPRLTDPAAEAKIRRLLLAHCENSELAATVAS